jgi:hypothetical protein
MTKRKQPRITREDVLRAEDAREVDLAEFAERLCSAEQLKEASLLAAEELTQAMEALSRKLWVHPDCRAHDYRMSLRVLGLVPPSTRDQIETAYRKLARVHHPDTGGSAYEFRRIETAYRTALELNGGK